MRSYVHEKVSTKVVADHLAPNTRLLARFRSAQVMFPPKQVTLIVLKEEKQLELWSLASGHWNFIYRYPIQAASGEAGPKLREGDRQVPEGFYSVSGLNPNSRFYLSIKLDYPNSFDLEWADREGRIEPGSDIYIHGKAESVGCLAMGDEAIEELFSIVGCVGMDNISVLISPRDARARPIVPVPHGSPGWVESLYERIETELQKFKL